MGRLQAYLAAHKMDEMERDIQTQAVKITYYFVIFVLFMWTMVENFLAIWNHTGVTTLAPCLLLVCASVLQNLAALLLRRRKTEGDEEYRAAYPIGKLLLVAGITMALITIVGSGLTFLLIGMR